MAFIEMFSWWYLSGWGVFIKKVGAALSSIANYFSMSSLLRTLFKPYRQISAAAAGANTPLDVKFHMFIDRLISRLVGFFSRLILLIVGLIIIIIGGGVSLVLIIIWPLIPFLPAAGIVLSVMGVVL